MNIDFHYGVIYILARTASFDRADAETIAHACEYVDDSTVTGTLDFKSGQSFERFASAHEMLDHKNMIRDSDKRVWAPFHFLPACEGDTFEEKCVCRPDSKTARAIVKEAIRQHEADNALHRLGVTLHVYVDTWAHQGFTGTISPNNIVHKLHSENHDPEGLLAELRRKVSAAKDLTESELADMVSRLGHGAALHLPDLPWAVWGYINGYGKDIERNNLPNFMTAADMAYRAIKGFQSNNDNYPDEEGFPNDVKQALEQLLSENRSDDPQKRLEALMASVAKGDIPRLSEEVPSYVAKGPRSWKFSATGITSHSDDGDAPPVWSQVFEESDYRKFHEAAKDHRAFVTGTLLPKHGVRLA